MNTRLQISADTSLQAKVHDVQLIYNRYAGMLFGYIYDVVKDHALAEKYLADTFTTVAVVADDLNKPGENIFCKLQQIARNKMTNYFDTLKEHNVKETAANRPNPFLSRMNAEQLAVFCGIHYHGKNTATIAAEMNEEEEIVRRLLKEAFVIIRQGNNAGVY